jgi:hypothetical protein
MSDNAAKILGAAIVIASFAYFAVHLHASERTFNGSAVIYNTVTGNGYMCFTVDCVVHPPADPK